MLYKTHWVDVCVSKLAKKRIRNKDLFALGIEAGTGLVANACAV
jgi:hypothetical protein